MVDVWFLEPATGRWKYYDPSGYFGQNFNLTELIPGQLYLIRVVNEQTATLNHRERHLFAGWNRVHW